MNIKLANRVKTCLETALKQPEQKGFGIVMDLIENGQKDPDMLQVSRLLISYFHGRHDLYALNSVKEDMPFEKYLPSCLNSKECNYSWKRIKSGMKHKTENFPCQNCSRFKARQIDADLVNSHYCSGIGGYRKHYLCIYPLFADQTSWLLVFDFSDPSSSLISDNERSFGTIEELKQIDVPNLAGQVLDPIKEALNQDFKTGGESTKTYSETIELKSWFEWFRKQEMLEKEMEALRRAEALMLAAFLEEAGIPFLIERPANGKGAHVWIFFNQKIPAERTRLFADLLIRQVLKEFDQEKFYSLFRILPDPDHTDPWDQMGIIDLPERGTSVTYGRSALVDMTWKNIWPLTALKQTGRIGRKQMENWISIWQKSEQI